MTNTQLCCSAAGPWILLRGAKCVPGKQKVEILNEELMKMSSFPACCPFKFSFHGNRSGEAAWREPGEISAWPPSPPGCQLSHSNCQAFTEVFTIVIYTWNRSDGSSWVPSLRCPKVPPAAGLLAAELLSFRRLSGRVPAPPNPPQCCLTENVTPVRNIHSTAFSFFKSGGGCDLSMQTELGVVAEGQPCH